MKAHPSCEFFVFDGQVYYNNIPAQSGAIGPTVPVAAGSTSLYELNVDRMSGSTTVVGGPTFDGTKPGTGRFIGGYAEPSVVISDSPSEYTLLETWSAGPGPTLEEMYKYSGGDIGAGKTAGSSLVAWWKMAEAEPLNSATGSIPLTCTPIAADQCPTIDTSTTPSSLISSQTLRFTPNPSNADEYHTTPDIDALSFGTSPLTFACWIYIPSSAAMGYPFVLHKGTNSADPGDFEYFFGMDEQSGEYKFRVRLADADAYIGIKTDGAPINPDVWYHIAATWDGTHSTATSPYGLKLYLNGEEHTHIASDASSPGSFSGMVNGGEKLYIGSRTYQGNQHNFNGNMAHLAMWNMELSAEEIRALYESALSPCYESKGGFIASEIVDTGMIYPFVTKDGTRVSLSTVYTASTYDLDFEYGNVVSASYPFSSSITRELIGWYPAGEGADINFLTSHGYPADTAGGSRGAGQLDTGNPCLVTNRSDDFFIEELGGSLDGDAAADCAEIKSYLEGLSGDGNCLANNTISQDTSTETGYFSQEAENISCNSPKWRHYWALKNLYNNYTYKNVHYKLTSSYGIKDHQMINLISIPSIFYGSQIKPGTVSLKWYLTGTLIGELQDTTQNGVLYQVTGNNPYIAQYGVGDPAGVVFYDEGFIALTGSWKLNQDDAAQITMRSGSGGTFYSPTWLDWGAGANDKSNRVTTSVSGGTSDPYQAATTNNFESASFGLSFKGTSETQVLTMFANARRGEANYSNNPTYLVHKVDATGSLMTSSNAYIEDTTRLVVNFVSSSFLEHSASFKRQVYISRVGIYDDNKNLIGVATLSNPVRKAEDEDLTFKLKLDI